MGNTVEGWDYERFQDFVVNHAVNQGIVGRQALAERAGIKVGMLSKYYSGQERPSIGTLEKIHAAIHCDWNELLVAAGRASANVTAKPTIPPLTLHPRAQEINTMLIDASPLSPKDREYIESMIDRLIDPYRRQMRTRRKTG